MKSITKSQIVEKSGLTLRQVQFYTEEGLVVPEVEKGEGRGKARKYSWANLVHFLLIKELVDHGMTVSKMKGILKYVRSDRIVNGYTREKMHRKGFNLFFIITRGRDGRTEINLRLLPKDEPTSILVTDQNLAEMKSAIIINYGKLLMESELT